MMIVIRVHQRYLLSISYIYISIYYIHIICYIIYLYIHIYMATGFQRPWIPRLRFWGCRGIYVHPTSNEALSEANISNIVFSISYASFLCGRMGSARALMALRKSPQGPPRVPRGSPEGPPRVPRGFPEGPPRGPQGPPALPRGPLRVPGP